MPYRIKPAGYFLYGLRLGEQWVYLGQTRSFLTRFADHIRNKRFDTVEILAEVQDWAELDDIERKAIHAMHPPQNRQCPMPGCKAYAKVFADDPWATKPYKVRRANITGPEWDFPNPVAAWEI